jgi:aminomethyltransferase
MKLTAFNGIHKALGAKMVEFGGFEMPVQYRGIIEEHTAVRTGVGVFDVSHMGEFEVRGPQALAFLQRVTVNDVSKLTEGKVQYSAMPNPKGGIVDDLLVYHRGDRYMLVVNASNIAKDLAWLQSQLISGAELRDDSDAYSLLAVQGPKSLETLQSLTSVSLREIPYYHFRRGTIAGHDAVISRTGYTGELGFELYFDSSVTVGREVWDAVFAAGAKHGIQPIGLGARDTLRLEMGFCLYGNDIDDTTTPLQAGLGWITKLAKGDFVGRPVIEGEKTGGVPRRLVGLTLPEKNIARHGYPIVEGTKEVGVITSGTFSPTLQRSIAMGYVPPAQSAAGSSVSVMIRGRSVSATVTALPFVPGTATV